MVDFYKQFKYIINLFATIVIMLSAIITLNYLINPYHYFNSGILNDGNFTSFKLFKLPSKDIIMYKLLRDIETTEADTVIIGSSRVLRGFDTCNKPHILKIPKPGMSLNETKILLKEVLKKESVKTIFIEVLWIGSTAEQMEFVKKPNFFEASLSLNSILVSVNTLFDYFQTDESYVYPNCNCIFDQSFSYEHEEYYKKVFKQRLSNFSVNHFAGLLNDIAKEGKKFKNVNIRFVVLPYHKDLVDFTFSPLNSEKLRNQISNIRDKFKFMDFISYTDFIQLSPDFNRTLYNEEFWYDRNHFKPVIGDMFLKYMQQPIELMPEPNVVVSEKRSNALNTGIWILF